jgi:ABC-type dipeptide/oligopeptide/nickel transport system ATPase component
MAMHSSASPVLSVNDLVVDIPNGKDPLRILQHVSLTLDRGEILGIVGESGAGKSLLARCLLRLESPAEITSGEILLDGHDLAAKTGREMKGIRGDKISLVLQNPVSAMDPLFSMGEQFREVLAARRNGTSGNGDGFFQSIRRLLKLVGIASPEEQCRRYPHQWSRGMLQRGQLVMGFLASPSVLILDEVTSALDPTVCLQILDAVVRLKEEKHTAVLLITHDLFLAAEICDRVAVIQKGRIVETGRVRNIFNAPGHPYTRSLISAAREASG